MEEIKKEKRIFCLKGISNIGKSGTIIELAKILIPLSKKPVIWHIPSSAPKSLNDLPKGVNVEVWHKGFHIGLNGNGDVDDNIIDGLTPLAVNGCDVIFCACRTKGDPYIALNIFADKFGYSLITTAPYTIEIPNSPTTPTTEDMNKRKAIHLELLI